MILYYAMGGGLGHLTRSLAILGKAPQFSGSVRLMTSSLLTPMIIAYAPCPVDYVPGEYLSSMQKYVKFLQEYLQRYQIETIILDTFPVGIVGEWTRVGRELPRILIARYLRWEAYLDRINNSYDPFPEHTLVLEPLARGYHTIITTYSQAISLDAPIMLQEFEELSAAMPSKRGILIVHSGNLEEREELVKRAQDKCNEWDQQEGNIEMIFPERGIYPAEQIIPRYSYIISGAGYNMVAMASQAPTTRKHFLHPFQRRFDDQVERLKRFQKGLWQQKNGDRARQAANWLGQIIR